MLPAIFVDQQFPAQRQRGQEVSTYPDPFHTVPKQGERPFDLTLTLCSLHT